MIAKRLRVSVWLVLGCAFLWAPHSVYALALAESSLSFSNLQITPKDSNGNPVGSVNLLPWDLEAFTQAQNSLGELEQQFVPSTSPDTVSANAMVTWAEGHGDAAAPDSPPDLQVTANANSTVNIPAQVKDQFATSSGRGTLSNTLTITGGTGSVSVDFSGNIARSLHGLTQDNGVLADTETTFALVLSGGDLLDPVTALFSDDHLVIGPNSEDSRTGSLPSLFGTALLTFDVPYSVVLESDSESFGVVPEPSTIALLLLSLGLLAGFVRKQREVTSGMLSR